MTPKAELVRCAKLGAVSVMVIANIDGEDFTNPEIRAGLGGNRKCSTKRCWYIPARPQGVKDQRWMSSTSFRQSAMADTTLAFTRMIYSGFSRQSIPNIKLIASHGGASFTYSHRGPRSLLREMIPGLFGSSSGQDEQCYLQRILVRHRGVRSTCARALHSRLPAPVSRVLYSSDYPHNIGDMIGCLSRAIAPRRSGESLDCRERTRRRFSGCHDAFHLRVAHYNSDLFDGRSALTPSGLAKKGVLILPRKAEHERLLRPPSSSLDAIVVG